ncbi:hypothetical protein DMUE_5540 [Dictyocoela muelleri]|nr:hypothetical protein DMUE_5540 [Dictyocoela muelleri]
MNDKSNLYKIRAKILTNMNPDIILGMEFLMLNKAKIDLENMKIDLNDSCYELDDNEIKCEIEKKIINQTKIYCNPKIKLPPRCEDLLNFNTSKLKNIASFRMLHTK